MPMPLRRVWFQIHLWIGLAAGLYIVMMSLSGSALVFRRELVQAFSPVQPSFDGDARMLSSDELRAAVLRAYSGYTVAHIGSVQRRSPVVEISLARDGETIDRVFNAYTGEDLGDPFPAGARALLWLADLHDDLLMGRGRGRFWNGIGSVLVTVLCVTGALIWWRGARAWRRATVVSWREPWPRLAFDLHSASGFWFLAMLLVWAVSGIYLSFPAPFTRAVDAIWGSEPFGTRPGDVALEWLVRLHFGRWRSHTLKTVWVLVGLLPAIMFVTGAAMWWHRAVRRRRTSVREHVPGFAGAPQGIE